MMSPIRGHSAGNDAGRRDRTLEKSLKVAIICLKRRLYHATGVFPYSLYECDTGARTMSSRSLLLWISGFMAFFISYVLLGAFLVATRNQQ